MTTAASNFTIDTARMKQNYPAPEISYVTASRISVPTSIGNRQATRIRIHGRHFLIRAVAPKVIVNGNGLIYVIKPGEKEIDGYFFSTTSSPLHVIVDYGRGVRSEWRGDVDIRPAAEDEPCPPQRPEPCDDDPEPCDDERPRDERCYRCLPLSGVLLALAIVLPLGLALVAWAPGPVKVLGWMLLGAAVTLAIIAASIAR